MPCLCAACCVQPIVGRLLHMSRCRVTEPRECGRLVSVFVMSEYGVFFSRFRAKPVLERLRFLLVRAKAFRRSDVGTSLTLLFDAKPRTVRVHMRLYNITRERKNQ